MLSRWILFCTLGVAAGRVAVGVIADILLPHVVRPTDVESELVVHRAIMLVSGAVEGAGIGVFQWLALRRLWTAMRPSWILATTIGIGVGWFAGILVSAAEPAAEPSVGHTIFFGGLTGAVLGAITGGAQAYVVRADAPWPTGWVLASAVAWAIAMLVSFVGSAELAADDWGLFAVVVNLVTGGSAGLLVGAVTGPALGTLRPPQSG